MKIISPLYILVLVWSICLMVIEFGPIKYIQLTLDFYFVFFSALFAFGASYVITRFFVKNLIKKSTQAFPRDKFGPSRSNRNIVRLIIAFVTGLIGLHAWNFYAIAGGLDLGLYRSLITDEGESMRFAALITLLNPFAYLSLVLLIAFNSSRRQLYLIIILLVIFFVLSTGRSAFLVVALMTGWYLYFKGKIKSKEFIFSVLLFCVFFAAMGQVLGKISEESGAYMFLFIDDVIPQNWFTIAFFNILLYMTSGVVAFSDYVNSTTPSFEVYHTGKNFYKVFAPLMSVPPDFPILPNAYVPFPTNVYTFLFPAYADFGVVGIVFTFLMYGFIGGGLYTAFQIYRTEYFAMLLALFYSIISLSVFHDYTYSSIFPYSCFLLLFVLRKKLGRRI